MNEKTKHDILSRINTFVQGIGYNIDENAGIRMHIR